MALPVRSKATINWVHPAADLQPNLDGLSLMHSLADIRDSGDSTDPGKPVNPTQWFWANTVTRGIRILPELRGAIMTPLHSPLPTASRLVPATSTWTPAAWYDADSNAAGEWSHVYHEGAGYEVALHQTQTTGYLRTIAQEPEGRGVVVWSNVLTPDTVAGDTPVASGLYIALGIDQYGRPHYVINLPNPHKDDDRSGWWTLYRYTGSQYEAVDWFEAKADKATDHESATQWVSIIPTCGWLVIQSSLSKRAWVVYREGGLYPRAGYVGVSTWGAAGWVGMGYVVFPPTATIYGPKVPIPSTVYNDADVRPIVLARQLAPDEPAMVTYTATYEPGTDCGRVSVALQNTSELDYQPPSYNRVGRRRTPIMWWVQENHWPTYDEGEGAVPVELETYAKSVQITYPETGVGARATITLDNRTGDLDGLLPGMGWVSVALAHQYADDAGGIVADAVPAFAGYVTRQTYGVDARLQRTVTLECGDRSCLWQDGMAPAEQLPEPQGWDFREIATVWLQWQGVNSDDILWPDDYPDDGWTVPVKFGERQAYTSGASLPEALTSLCEAMQFTWRLTRAGQVEFLWWPPTNNDATFILDETTVTPEDKIWMPTAHETDFLEMRNWIIVRGRDERGYDVAATRYNPDSLENEDSPLYVGRRLRRIVDDPDAHDPVPRANRLLAEQVTAGQTINWRTIGRDVWPGDVVLVKVSHLEVPTNTLFRVTSKTLTFDRQGGNLLWKDEMTGAIIG